MSAGNIGAAIPPKGFLDAMSEHGLLPDPKRIMPGVFYRFPGSGKSKASLSGWCKLFDDCMGGVFGDYASSVKGHWQARHEKKMTLQEEKAYLAKVEKAYKESIEATKKNQARGASNALKIWEAASAAPADHPYLIKKGITGLDDSFRLNKGTLVTGSIRLYQGSLVIRDMACNGALIIPAYDETGKLATLAFIQVDGDKRFLTGCKKGGSFFMIGLPNKDLDNALNKDMLSNKTILDLIPSGFVPGSSAICIAEGFATGASIHKATGYPVAVSFDAGNLVSVASIIKKRHPWARLVICADNDHHEDGKPNTGILAANNAAKETGGLVAVPELINGAKTDFNDLAQEPDGEERIRACITAVLDGTTGDTGTEPEDNTATDNLKRETPEETVARLATLSLLEYDRVRQLEAETLGVRASTLDKEVARVRGKETDDGSGQAVIFEENEPWPDPIDGAVLLDDLATIFKRFVVLPPHADKTIPLWCMLTYLPNSVDVLPILNITSPEKRCGKSTLLTVINCLVNRPLLASSITPSAMFRSIDLWSPTLLIDEADTFITGENESLRGVINSGHTKDTAYIIRNCGDNHEPRRFTTWGPKVLCGIGQLPGTVKDRSILIELKRRTNSEPIEKMRYVNADTFVKIKRKMARFAADIRFKMAKHRPDIPGLLHDRAGDNWGPLLSIAHYAGGGWPDLARSAALSLVGVEKEAVSVNVELLADIKTVFDSLGVDHISSENLIDGLCENKERPWATWNKGEQISPRQLSKKLSGFEISPKLIRLSENKVLRGYERKQFNDAFSRYTLSYPLQCYNSATAGV